MRYTWEGIGLRLLVVVSPLLGLSAGRLALLRQERAAYDVRDMPCGFQKDGRIRDDFFLLAFSRFVCFRVRFSCCTTRSCVRLCPSVCRLCLLY